MNTACRLSARARKRALFNSDLRTYHVEQRKRSAPPDFTAIDAKWQSRWRNGKQWNLPTADKGKFYVLPMFPYPSGALHIGHLRNYTISDVIARYRRMKGYNVLHPIGWDAFGLPAENAAIEKGLDPAKWTNSNIAAMRSQLDTMGGCWDWDKELSTASPDFYKDTQALFLKLYQHGLAYQADATVNYDPVDRTVLANEQVDGDGCSWRSGAKVEKINLRQWFFRITNYASELLESLDELAKEGNWPQRVVAMQKNWLGKSEGTMLRFPVHSTESRNNKESEDKVEVFTTRADSLFGVQYLALSLNHPTVQRCARSDPNLRKFIDSPDLKDYDSKAGYRINNLSAKNPVQNIVTIGAPYLRQDLPVFAAPYVRADYAHGAVMGVPAHDERDFVFWMQNRLESDDDPRYVIEPPDIKGSSTEEVSLSGPLTGFGKLSVKCQQYQGLLSKQSIEAISSDLIAHDPNLAEFKTNWRLRDWLVSRQRYWGTPIPIIHCMTCGAVPVPEDDLPVKLPSLSSEQWSERQGNPLEELQEWKDVACPNCGGAAQRETDTMDTFVDSSWYYLHFAKSGEKCHSGTSYMPADLYIGGVEHAILHLLYARFISKFLSKAYPSSGATEEPFSKLLTQGMVHGRTFTDPATGKFLKPGEVKTTESAIAEVRATGEPAVVSFEKMSKSKHNGVDPSECVRKYGADITRTHLLFQAPVDELLNWDEDKITGVQRWFNRVWLMSRDAAEEGTDSKAVDHALDLSSFDNESVELWKMVQETIISTDRSLSSTYSLNTIVSDLMSLTNMIQRVAGSVHATPLRSRTVVRRSLKTLLRLMTPIAPSFSEECWSCLHGGDLEDTQFDPSQTASLAGFPHTDGSLDKLEVRSFPCALQVNGKFKVAVRITKPPDDIEGNDLKAWILQRIAETQDGAEALRKWNIDSVRRVIVARSGKTVNLVF
ncbi:MAG: Leucyl-tRNA synthetase, mitochondrial [Alyxoria varia]|nr:MAG: Leucyl-tRNA synthetase, mitochondrial [Alyxoria varia]